MFADDLKLFRKIDSLAGCVTLQEELNSIFLWFNSIDLKFNTDKYKPMSFTRCCSPIIYSCSINNTHMNVVTIKIHQQLLCSKLIIIT